MMPPHPLMIIKRLSAPQSCTIHTFHCVPFHWVSFTHASRGSKFAFVTPLCRRLHDPMSKILCLQLLKHVEQKQSSLLNMPEQKQALPIDPRSSEYISCLSSMKRKGSYILVLQKQVENKHASRPHSISKRESIHPQSM